MHRHRGLRVIAGLLATTLLVSAGGGQVNQSGRPHPVELGGQDEPDTLLRFQMIDPSPRVNKISDQLGFAPMPLITKSRFYDSETDSFDGEKYQANIWDPMEDPVPGIGGWEKYGIPPDWKIWIDLDFEEWDPIFNPEDYDHETVVSRVRDYERLITATRSLRPQAMVCIHGLVRNELVGESGSLIEQIVTQCDATSPSMASNLEADLSGWEAQLEIKRERLEACLKLKAEHGTKVFPLVGKRFRLKDEDGVYYDEKGRRHLLLLPGPYLREMMEVIFTAEYEGLKVDGVIVWGVDNRILRSPNDPHFVLPDTDDQRTVNQTDIQFFEIIDETHDEFFVQYGPIDDESAEPADPRGGK